MVWQKTENYEEALFTKDGQEMNAYYDSQGNLVGITTLKSYSDLPTKGQMNLKALFNNYSIGQIVVYKNNAQNKTPMILWGAELVDSDNYFVELVYGSSKLIVCVDPNGNVSFFKQI